MSWSDPSRFSPEACETVVEALRAGASYDTAAAKARTTRRSISRWRERGHRELASLDEGAEPIESEAPYAAFVLDAEQALADCELSLLAKLQTSPAGQWQRAAWVLERRFGYLAREQREVVVHEAPDPATAFGTQDPAELARAAENLLGWD